MNLEDIRTLYDYNSWSNHRILDACAALSDEQFTRDLASSFRSVRDTLAHILGAEWIWLERWHGRSPSGLPLASEFSNLEALRSRWAGIERDLHDYVASLTAEDLTRNLQVKTLAGQTYTQAHWQMLQHLVNHGTYHRGQITTLLRQLGAKAVSTDLIAFYRERASSGSA